MTSMHVAAASWIASSSSISAAMSCASFQTRPRRTSGPGVGRPSPLRWYVVRPSRLRAAFVSTPPGWYLGAWKEALSCRSPVGVRSVQRSATATASRRPLAGRDERHRNREHGAVDAVRRNGDRQRPEEREVLDVDAVMVEVNELHRRRRSGLELVDEGLDCGFVAVGL